MSSIYYIAAAPAIAQVDTFTPGGSITAGDVDTLTAIDEGGNTVVAITYTAPASPSVAIVAAGLIAAWNSNAAAAAIATATGSSAVVLTAKTAGVPQFVTGSVAGAGTISKASTIANSGPSDLNSVANYSTGAKPVTGDSLLIDGRAAAPILYGLNQSGVTLASLIVDASMTNQVGSAMYPVRMSATSATFGQSQLGRGQAATPRINWDFGTVATAVAVLSGTNSTADAGREPIRIKGSNAANTLAVAGGLVGLATNLPADTANFPTITVTGGALNTAPGVTAGTLNNVGGVVNINGGMTTVSTYTNGTTRTYGTGTIGSVNPIAGRTYIGNRPASGAAVTTLNMVGGSVDFSVNPLPATVGTLNVGPGSVKVASASQMTFSAIAIAFGVYSTFSASLG